MCWTWHSPAELPGKHKINSSFGEQGESKVLSSHMVLLRIDGRRQYQPARFWSCSHVWGYSGINMSWSESLLHMPLDGFAPKQTAYEQRVSQILWGPHYAKRYGAIEVFALFFPLASVFFNIENGQASVLTLIFPSFHHSLSIPTSPQGYLA